MQDLNIVARVADHPAKKVGRHAALDGSDRIRHRLAPGAAKGQSGDGAMGRRICRDLHLSPVAKHVRRIHRDPGEGEQQNKGHHGKDRRTASLVVGKI